MTVLPCFFPSSTAGGDDRGVRLVVGDDLEERHLLHRAEVVHPDDVPGPLAPLGEPGDGDASWCSRRRCTPRRGGLHLGEEPALEVEVLEDGLDDHVRAVEARESVDAVTRASTFSSPRRSSRRRRTRWSRSPRTCASARPTEASSRSLIADRELGLLGRDEGDAAAHQAAAEHRDLLDRSRLRRAVHPGVLLQRGGGEEELAEPRADLAGEQLAEGAGLGAQTGLEALLLPFADDLEGALRRRVVAAALPEQLLACLGEEEPPADGVALQRGPGHGLPGAPVRLVGDPSRSRAPGRARPRRRPGWHGAPPRRPGRACAPWRPGRPSR